MRSHDEPRQQKTPSGASRQGVAVNPREAARGGPSSLSARPQTPSCADDLMEVMLERTNMWRAIQHVEANNGAAGMDHVTVADLRSYVPSHWPDIRVALLAGTYQPQPVRRVAIPKPAGGVRNLGIPTVVDRLIQQALLQVLTPIFDPHFADQSYGFRPGRSAHHAVLQAQTYIRDGYAWTVDIDLKAFFDHVNHDMLMARRVSDKRVLRLIRRYLEAGVLIHGVVMRNAEGTQQGGPLSPLLANILLDDFDRELTKRGHHFVRYADVYIHSQGMKDLLRRSRPWEKMEGVRGRKENPCESCGYRG